MMVLLMRVNCRRYLSFTRGILHVSTFGTRCSLRMSKTENTANPGKESVNTLSHSSLLEIERVNSDSINESSQEKQKVSANT